MDNKFIFLHLFSAHFLTTRKKKKKERDKRADEWWDVCFELFYLYETFMLEWISLVAALCIVKSSGICPGCQQSLLSPSWGSLTPLCGWDIAGFLQILLKKNPLFMQEPCMSSSLPVYGTNSLLTALLVLVEKTLIQHSPGNTKINDKINPKVVYSAWEEKYITNHILYPGIQVVPQCQQQTGDVVSGGWIFHVTQSDVGQKHMKAPSFLVLPTQENAHKPLQPAQQWELFQLNNAELVAAAG